MPDAPPQIFDRRRHRRSLDRAAAGFEQAGFLHARAAEDAVERLAAVNRRFRDVLVLGARRGEMAAQLAAAGVPEAGGRLVEADLSAAMLAGRPGLRAQVDEEALPFADGAFDLVLAPLSLHWTNDLVGALVQIRRALRPDGLFLGALLGGSTLGELRAALLEAETEVRGGAAARVSPFADAFDVAALLQRAGFALPVADRECLTVRYADPLALLRDLRAMGEGNALAHPAPPLTRPILARAFEILAARADAGGGRVAARFDLIGLTGWSPHESQPKPLRPGSAKARLADALGAVETPLRDGP